MNNNYSVIKALLYFEIFDHPLNEKEILKFSKVKNGDLKNSLDFWIKKGVVKEFEGYYSTGDVRKFVQKRQELSRNVSKVMKKAIKRAELIGKFPYIRAVFISGSLSKGIFDKDDDVDFFIVTAKNRLWIARTLLVLYKKIFLLNSNKYFCINYFVTQDNLHIDEKNIFTAVELSTLIPVIGNIGLKDLLAQNKWAFSFFPNIKDGDFPRPLKHNSVKVLFEKLFNTKIGEILERTFTNITVKRLKLKYSSIDNFDLVFKSNEKVSKHHPKNYQKIVVEKLNEKIEKLNKKYNLNIPKEK